MFHSRNNPEPIATRSAMTRQFMDWLENAVNRTILTLANLTLTLTELYPLSTSRGFEALQYNEYNDDYS